MNGERIVTFSDIKDVVSQTIDLENAHKLMSENIIATRADLKGNITYVSKKFEEISGYKKEELLGKPHNIVRHPEMPSSVFKDLWTTIKKGEVWEGVVKNLKKDGDYYVVDAKVIPERNAMGDIESYLSIRVDITQSTNLINEQIKMQKHKDIFLANMSHDMRTPLNGITGFLDLLKKDMNPTEQQLKYLDLLQSSSSILKVLINDILDFSKLAEGKLELDIQTVKLKEELRKTLNIFSEEISRKSIIYKIEIDELLSQNILCDKNRLNQVVINLIGNAIKFTDNGLIYFTAAVLEQSDKNLKVRFSIKDTGKGIPKNKQKAIFSAFTQEDNTTATKFGGTGLGLSISKNIVELMGSQLELQSADGEGSEFFFIVNFEKGGLLLGEEEEEEEVLFSGSNILVVEDNLTNQILIEILLEDKGVTVTIAEDGIEGLKLYKQDYSKFDMVLTDMNMPNMDGGELFQNIMIFEKENNINHTPTVILTANTIKGDKEKFLKQGFDAYLSKPLDKKELNKILIEYLVVT